MKAHHHVTYTQTPQQESEYTKDILAFYQSSGLSVQVYFSDEVFPLSMLTGNGVYFEGSDVRIVDELLTKLQSQIGGNVYHAKLHSASSRCAVIFQ